MHKHAHTIPKEYKNLLYPAQSDRIMERESFMMIQNPCLLFHRINIRHSCSMVGRLVCLVGRLSKRTKTMERKENFLFFLFLFLPAVVVSVKFIYPKKNIVDIL